MLTGYMFLSVWSCVYDCLVHNRYKIVGESREREEGKVSDLTNSSYSGCTDFSTDIYSNYFK